MSSDILFTLLYILLSICIVYPPVEFVTAGITIPVIFSKFLGSESENFIYYHITKSNLTLFIYSSLPLVYVFGLYIFGFSEEVSSLWSFSPSYLWQYFMTTCLILPLLAAFQIKRWSTDGWTFHPIATTLTKFSNNNSDWKSIAADINTEYRRVDKICIQSNAICQVVATENWILKVMPFALYVAHQSDASLVVSQSDTHYSAQSNSGEVQYVNIEVKSSRDGVQPFSIRVNALDFKDLQDRVARPIAVLPSVTFHKSLMEKFVDAFKDIVKDNTRYTLSQELDNCIGCMQVMSNVKLQKVCPDEGTNDRCGTCYCRPMWCVDCMARWFASRQDGEQPDTWFSSKCTCPMCRAKFCILDVCLINRN